MIRRVRRATPASINFWCPACESVHGVINGTGTERDWQWNGNEEFPTFSPSINVTYNGPDADTIREDGSRAPSAICHSFVTNGVIQYLNDCTHQLAGQEVELPNVHDGWPHQYDE